ncbi:MAG: hypothetical protein HYW27_03865, partial [Candidatus Aenigmarchaeota archaeon]|nr:hypothetical protein [Candidatus Aenigmarchaeota archaeon]
ITVNLPLNITYNITSNVTVNATFSEPVDVCKAEMNGANSTFACNTNTSVDLVEGNNTIRIWSNDTSGNINSAFVTLSFNPHSLPSVTTLSLPAFVNVTTQITVSTVINFTTAYVGNLSFIWYKNGAFSTNNTLLGVQNNTLITNTYNDTFTHFDMITVEVRPYKTSKGFGDFVNASVTAANTPPTTGIPAITPTEAYTNTTISCTPQNSADADNDTVTTTYAWIKNGVVIGGQTSSTLDGAAQFQRGDVITCQVTPNDGFASGNATNSSAATVLDSPPTMPTFVTSDITKANSSYSAFTFTAGGSVDNDTDTITYQYEANHTGSFVNIGNSTGSITWNITNLTSGFFSIRARANTTINNSAYLTNQTIFEIDTTKVAFTNPTPLNNTYINTSVLTINATVIMPDLTRVYANVSGTIINMTNSTPSVFSTSITLEDGMYSYFVTAESLSGANTTEVRVVHVDTLTPAISSVEIVSDKPNNLVRSGSATYIISSLPGIGGGQNLTFTINASDASTLTVKLVNGTQTFSDSTAPYTFILHINMSSISETRNLSINVTDAAGNSNRTDIELVFDNTPPATTHSLNDSSDLLHLSSPVIYFGGVVSEQLVVNGTSSDASSLGTFFSASPYTNVSTFSALTGLWSVTYILNNTSSNGTVSINITDLLGNPASIQLNIAKDAASPSAPAILQMPSLTTIIPNLIWTPATDTGSGIRGYMVMRSNDNATYTNVSSMLTATSFNDTSSPEGLVYYKIMAFDNVNNTNVSGTTNTSVDLFAPLVASVNATKINAAGTVVNITANITDVAGVNDATVSATLMNQSGGVVYVTNMTKVSELYNFTWNTTGLAEGLYYVQINASDVLSRTRSINKALVIVLTGSSTTTPQSVFTNSSVTTAANTTNSVNTSVGLALDLVTNSSATGSINVLSYNTNPVGSASGVTSLLALNKYFDIILSDNLNSTLSNATIKISYTDAEVSGIDESSLKIYLWTGSTWQAQPSTVDTAANIVSATVPHFSIYSTFGSAPAPAPPAPSVSGGGGGGGGFSACTENWACTSYSACSAGGLQKRTCVDKNRCGSVRSKPAETQLCVYTPTPACGNGIVETGEECDSVPQACTTDDGYVGKQACSTTCRAGICIPFEKCGDGVCNGPETSSTCSADCKAGETGGIETPTGMAISEAADPLLSAILIIGAIIIVFTAWRIMRNRRAAERPIRKKR